MATSSSQIFIFLISMSISIVDGTQLIIVNNCKESIWPGILGSAGHQTPQDGGFHLYSGEQVSLQLPENWSGRIWGRQGCCFDQKTGKGSCLTGDCAGLLHCRGIGGVPPATVVEMTLGTSKSSLHYYDVSLVDGFNVPVSMSPIGGGVGCGLAACEADVNKCCPSALEVRRGGKVVGCKSACLASKSDKYCCTGQFASRQSCKPTVFSRVFKAICPRAYSYAYDDSTSLKERTSSKSTLMDPNVEDGKINEDVELGWGKSLPVPSVQEMVKNDSESVPERYIKEYQDRPIDSTLSPHMFDNIPVIDFYLLVSGDGDELNKLDSACKEWGFFQLINHGVEVEVLNSMKAAVAAFFDLPLEEKKKYAMAENDIQGFGQAYVVSEHQKLDWCDLSFLITQPPEYRNFKYWPTTLPGFKEAIDEYSKEVEKVTVEICECLSRLMGLDKHGLKRLHGVMKQSMRLNYYPRCSRPDLVLGVSPHSDGGSITFLLQDDEITALQIKYKERWLPVKPIPNALVVNVGDALEAWSNGVYRSIEHRAVTNTKKERISIATFVLPDEEVQIGPVESMMVDRPRLYRNVKFLDYLKQCLDKKMDGKSHTSFLKLEKEL